MKTAITWLLLCISLFSNATQASTENPETGMFLLRSDDGSWQPALLLNTDMQVQISGPVAEVQIRQSFSNPGGAFAEGRYVLPTSESAATSGTPQSARAHVRARRRRRSHASVPGAAVGRPAVHRRSWSARGRYLPVLTPTQTPTPTPTPTPIPTCLWRRASLRSGCIAMRRCSERSRR